MVVVSAARFIYAPCRRCVCRLSTTVRPAKASSIYDLQPNGKVAMLMALLDWD
jgi:hypothetical protein